MLFVQDGSDYGTDFQEHICLILEDLASEEQEDSVPNFIVATDNLISRTLFLSSHRFIGGE